MFDGDIVVTALVRRAMKNEKLHRAIANQWGGTFPSSWLNTAQQYAEFTTRQLPEIAAIKRRYAEAQS